MKKSLIIVAFVVSAIVWALTYSPSYYWALPGGAYTAYLVGLVGAVIGLFIALVIKKFKPIRIFWGIFSAAVGSFLLLSLFMFRNCAPTQGNDVQPVDIYCKQERVEPENIYVKKRAKITWTIHETEAGTKFKIHEIRHTTDPVKRLRAIFGYSPTDNSKYEKLVTQKIEARVRQDRDGCYKYTVKCTSDDGVKHDIDPMIWVPK